MLIPTDIRIIMPVDIIGSVSYTTILTSCSADRVCNLPTVYSVPIGY
jgi:hypothetical protein